MFKIYDANQGLASLGGACMVQDRAGYLLLCTEHGVFAYDGRRFVNLGTDQGLRQGGDIHGIALTSTGRMAVAFADEVFVSDRSADASHPPSSLSFHVVAHPGVTFYSERLHRLVAWQDGLVVLAGAATERIVVPQAGSPRFEAMGYNLDEQGQLGNATAVFAIGEHLWESFNDGRLCAADPGAVRCFSAADGLTGGPWSDVAAGPGRSILARSAGAIASFDPATRRWTVTALPDQGGRYTNHAYELGLFRTPDGSYVTQADHGLAELGPDGWRLLRVEDGAPSGLIVSAMTDATGQFWFQVLGRGLVRWVGYRHWEILQRADGLSDGIPWQTARSPAGALWVSTDTGLDEVVRRGPSLRVNRVFPGASFALAVGPRGELWRNAAAGAEAMDPLTGTAAGVSVPPVNAIVSGPGEAIWFATQAGLFKVDDHPSPRRSAVLEGSPRAEVVDVADDGAGGVYYLAGGRLRHHGAGDTDGAVTGAWPDAGFEPLALVVGHDGNLWIGGSGGLYRFVLSGDHVASYQLTPTADTLSNSIVAVMVDHRGWVWAGTSLGVSVFNGRRWVSVDSDGGLASDDVDQGGLREDPDGSVWIVTTQGVSHLLHPEWLFDDQPIKAVVSEALLGSHPVLDRRMPYSQEALSLQFGASSYGAERSFVFRYKLSGVDGDWAESSTGLARYPFVPPGRHVLTLVGYNELTHRASPPASLVIDMAYPWWQQWWSQALWALCAIGLIYAAMRVRFRTILARQAELKRYVAEATEQLRYQALHDSLTGLLNRSEVERRLAEKLSSGPIVGELLIALIDIDHFKRVNDNYGHLGGDDVLRNFGRMICQALRGGEFAGRYGGEEILLVLDDRDGHGAERVLDLHRAVRGGPFNAAGKAIRITCSIGLAWAILGDDWESLIGRADDALYQAKAAGRDQVAESSRTTPAIRRIADRRFRPSAS